MEGEFTSIVKRKKGISWKFYKYIMKGELLIENKVTVKQGSYGETTNIFNLFGLEEIEDSKGNETDFVIRFKTGKQIHLRTLSERDKNEWIQRLLQHRSYLSHQQTHRNIRQESSLDSFPPNDEIPEHILKKLEIIDPNGVFYNNDRIMSKRERMRSMKQKSDFIVSSSFSPSSPSPPSPPQIKKSQSSRFRRFIESFSSSDLPSKRSPMSHSTQSLNKNFQQEKESEEEETKPFIPSTILWDDSFTKRNITRSEIEPRIGAILTDQDDQEALKMLPDIETFVGNVIIGSVMGKIVEANRGANALFGWDSLKGLLISELIPENFRAKHDGYLFRYEKRGAPSTSFGSHRKLQAITREKKIIDIRILLVELPKKGYFMASIELESN